MDKLKIKEFLQESEVASYRAARSMGASQSSSAAMLSPSEFLNQFEDYEVPIDELPNDIIQMSMHKENLRLLDRLSFDKTSIADLGAIVEMNDQFYVLAFERDEFELNGQIYTGIGAENEIFSHIQGKKKGFSFLLYGKLYIIKEVY